MRKSLLAILVVVASVGATVGLSPTRSIPAPVALAIDMRAAAPAQAPPAQTPLAGAREFMAKKEDAACLEQCYLKEKQQCEKENKAKNRPGTKENWD